MVRSRLWLLVCGGSLGVLMGAAGQDDPSREKAELDRHQGTWVATSSVFDGEEAPVEIVRSIRRIVTDDHVVWERSGKRFAGTRVVLDAKAQPAAIDIIPDGGRNRGEHILGIYKLDGDEITICVAQAGQPRPTDFKAEKGSRLTLQRFKRDPRPAK
jgi:uncharacterized protein (TIGR03067 family)